MACEHGSFRGQRTGREIGRPLRAALKALNGPRIPFTPARFPHSSPVHFMKKILLGVLAFGGRHLRRIRVFEEDIDRPSVARGGSRPGGDDFLRAVSRSSPNPERWPQTALAQIWAEPEMQAFLAKPREKAPGDEALAGEDGPNRENQSRGGIFRGDIDRRSAAQDRSPDSLSPAEKRMWRRSSPSRTRK